MNRLTMKMKLRVATAVLIYVLFAVLLVQNLSCSSERQQRVYHSVVHKKEKCPYGFLRCTCVERKNRKLDITCRGVVTNDLKVSTWNYKKIFYIYRKYYN